MKNNFNMIFSNFLKHSREKIGTRIFYFFTVTIVVIYSSFVAFFAYYERHSLEENLIHKGKELSNILTYNSRLGVLTENATLLKDPIEGIMQNRDAILVQIFALDGSRLTTQHKYKELEDHGRIKDLLKMQPYKMDILKKSTTVSFSKEKDLMEFWAPVISKAAFTEENIYFDEVSLNNKSSVTGFTRIVFTTKFMNRNLRNIFLKSILLPIIFMVPACIIAHFIIRSITRPLRSLTDQVRALGAGESVEKLIVETSDEVGKLADAFNNMAESLKNREMEKQQLEERLRHAHKMEAIGTLVGGIAHDFNNILCATIGYGKLLKKTTKGDPIGSRYVENLMSSAKKGDALVKNLLTYSRKQEVCLEPVNLNAVISNMQEFLSRFLNESIELIMDLEKEDLSILADQAQLERILINLVTNARDAMPDGGTLTIETKKVRSSELSASNLEKVSAEKNAVLKTFNAGSADLDFVKISVADTGTGIDLKTKERMFDPFFTTKKSGKGTGLGLSIVYGSIEQHNGCLEVTSELGEGTIFKIFFPVMK